MTQGEGEQPSAATSMRIGTSSQRALAKFICVSFTGRRPERIRKRGTTPKPGDLLEVNSESTAACCSWRWLRRRTSLPDP